MPHPVPSVFMWTILLLVLFGTCCHHAAPAAAFTFTLAPSPSRTKETGLMKGVPLLHRKNEVICFSSPSSLRSGRGEWDNDDFMSSLSDTPRPSPPKETSGGGGGHRRRVSNTSDMYLEQLKIDSTSRTRARLEGDEKAANDIWADPEIDVVKERLESFLTGKTKKMVQNSDDFLYTTSPDEMLEFIGEGEEEEEEEDEELDRCNSGESYRQRMVEKVKRMDSPVIDAVVTSARKDGDTAARKAAASQEQPKSVDVVEEATKSSTVEGAIDVEVLK